MFMWFADTFHYKTLQILHFTMERVCVYMVVMEMKYMAVVKGRCIAVEERVSIAMGGIGWQGEWVWCR